MLIPLTQGYSAIIDDADYKLVSQYKWHALVTHLVNSNHVSAAAWIRGMRPRRAVRMSHLILNILSHELGDRVVDHINRNPLDNRRANLRVIDRRGNSLNSPKSEKARGIYYDKNRNRYKVFILSDKAKRKYVGTFLTIENAEEAKAIAERKA